MRTCQRFVWIGMCMSAVFLLMVVGCRNEGGEKAPPPGGAAENQYEVKGQVVAVDPDGQAVTIDHEEIPGLMKAMEMKFNVEGPAILEGIQAGDQVQGRLIVRDSDYVITELNKQP